mmetsp:Transcript_24269/g.33318  ORF Transcript_24269/g.33318 Transcript_24269/m.33318 type:complete len:163 (+) Transcript_24269:133-621(+)
MHHACALFLDLSNMIFLSHFFFGIEYRSQFKESGNTQALYVAAENGFPEIVQILLERGAKVETPKNKKTPLYIAAQRGHQRVVQVLLEKGANMNFLNEDGKTPLYIAAERGHHATVQILLENGADPETSKNETTPLFIASQNGHDEVVQLLLKGNSGLKKYS